MLGLLSHKIGSLDFSLLVSSLPSQYEDSQTAFTDEAFLPSLSTICSLSLSEKKLHASKDSFLAEDYTATRYDFGDRVSKPTCGGRIVASGKGSWVTECGSCDDIMSCDLKKAVWIAHNCRHKDFVGVGDRYRKTELGECLSKKMLIFVGDSILRGPVKRLLSPFASTEQLKYWPGHSFGSILGTRGIMTYWDYIKKDFLPAHEVRDEKNPTDVLKHMIDNHIHPDAWKDREATFIVGGTSSYLSEFVTWFNDCEEGNFFGCPWLASKGGKGVNVVIKGAGVSKFWVDCKDKSSEDCFQLKSEKNIEDKEDAVKNGFGFIDIAAITGSLWSTLRPGDAGACGCHFCVDNYDEAVNFSEMDVLAGKWRGRVEGSVCSTLANLLATEICDGEREQFI